MGIMIVAWLVNIALGYWVFTDARRRKLTMSRALSWSIATILIGPLHFPFYLIIAAYLARRPLRAGEIRKGGPLSNTLINTAGLQALLTGGLLALTLILIGIGWLSREMWPVFFTTAVTLLFFTVVVAVIAIIMRDRSIVEEGPIS